MTNKAVAKAWGQGWTAGTAQFHTDGKNLYSYALCVGYTDEDGLKVLKDYRRQISVTTSRHCGLAALVADKIESV